MDEQNFTDFIKRRKTLVPPIGGKINIKFSIIIRL